MVISGAVYSSLSSKADRSTTLSGYGITDAQSKLSVIDITSQISNWNLPSPNIIAKRYGNIIHLHVTFTASSALTSQSLFSIPAPVGLYETDTPPLISENGEIVATNFSNSSYNLIFSRILVPRGTWMFDWVYCIA